MIRVFSPNDKVFNTNGDVVILGETLFYRNFKA